MSKVKWINKQKFVNEAREKKSFRIAMKSYKNFIYVSNLNKQPRESPEGALKVKESFAMTQAHHLNISSQSFFTSHEAFSISLETIVIRTQYLYFQVFFSLNNLQAFVHPT